MNLPRRSENLDSILKLRNLN